MASSTVRIVVAGQDYKPVSVCLISVPIVGLFTRSRKSHAVDGLVDFRFEREGYAFVYGEYDVAVVVGAVYRHIPFDKSVEGGLSGVIEGVSVRFAAYYRIFAVDGVEEFFRRGRFAAVVSDFQHVAVKFSAYAVNKQRLVDFVAVTCQYDAETVVFQYADGRNRIFLLAMSQQTVDK